MNFATRWWLARKLTSRNHAVQLRVAIRLAQSGDARAIQPLIIALETGDSYSSRKAAEALGLIKDSRVVKPLIEALSHKEPSTRRTAQEALVRLGGLSMGSLAEMFLNSARSFAVG
jgi:HEAT repeat protein